jgi:hypothetical protein
MTVDLHKEEGRQIVRSLSDRMDVLVENFRPGVMEKWGLGPKVSHHTLAKYSSLASQRLLKPVKAAPTEQTQP